MTSLVTYSLNLPLMMLTATADATSKADMLADAGINTLLGMGMAFAVLILISIIISLLPGLIAIFNKVASAVMAILKMIWPFKKKKKEEVKEAPKAESSDTYEEEELSDDEELVAVIAAAIAAYEGNSGFKVRSIRRNRRKAR